MSTNLFLIHGAWSSRKAFNFLKVSLRGDKKVGKINYFEYDIEQRSNLFEENTQNLTTLVEKAIINLSKLSGDTIVIGHSLGGLIALSLEHLPNVKSVITIASPISGIKLNTIAETIITTKIPVLFDVFAYSPFITNLQGKRYTKEIMCIVSNKGYNPMLLEKNDGVISIESQTTWKPSTAKFEYIDAPHNEILQYEEYVSHVKSML